MKAGKDDMANDMPWRRNAREEMTPRQSSDQSIRIVEVGVIDLVKSLGSNQTL